MIEDGMKKFLCILMSLATFPAYSQKLVDALSAYQNTLESEGSTSSTTTVAPVSTSSTTSNSSSKKCTADKQSSLPLKFLTSLILEKDGKLDISHDRSNGSLKIKAPNIIGNCDSMLEWRLKKPTIDGKPAYALEVGFKAATENKYSVYKMNGDTPQLLIDQVYDPTMSGFQQCLQDTGVLSMDSGGNFKVNPDAIYKTPVNENFSEVTDSGKLFFLSNGKSSSVYGPKYSSSFSYTNECDFYEKAHPAITSLLNSEDAESERITELANKLKNCPSCSYSELLNFMETYQGYSGEFSPIISELIQKAAQDAAKKIESGKYTDEDLQTISDFEKLVVQPKVAEVTRLYEEMMKSSDGEKKEAEKELLQARKELKSLGEAPYFLTKHTLQLMKDGNFEDAHKLNSLKRTISTYKDLGAKLNNIVITPEVANKRIASDNQAFAETIEDEREKFEYRRGMSSGKANQYSMLQKQMLQNINIRTQNYTDEIRSEYERMTPPNGYCFRSPFRNAQKCVNESRERIVELQNILNHYNKVDAERAKEYEAIAKEYGALEEEGRRYVAAENGETIVNEDQDEPEVSNLQAPSSNRESENSNVNQQQQQLYQQQLYQQQLYQQQLSQMQQMQPQINMFSQQQSPYQYSGASYMGQQGAWNFNWNGGQQYQMYQQPQQYQNSYNPLLFQGGFNFYR